MPVYAFQTIFQHESGLPEDRYVNTWHFYIAGEVTAGADFTNVRDMLKDFYTVAPTGNPPIYYYTDNIATPATVKAYNLSEPKPRAPKYEGTFPLVSMSAGSPMAYEVALCLSFEAERVSGEIQARRRNRLYLGPFGSNLQFTDGRPHPTAVTNIVNAAKRLHAAAAASVTWDWVVYSTTDNDWHLVDHLWVDNAYDIQRRRGLRPSARTEWYAGTP